MASVALTSPAPSVPENPRMAHDPKILERLRKPLEVSPNLIQGDKFVRWDEEATTGDTWCMVTMNVDSLGSILYWTDPQKEVTILHMAFVRDVRTGDFAKTPKDKYLAEQLPLMTGVGGVDGRLEDRTITVVYGTDLTNVTYYNFTSIAKSAEAVAKEWTRELFIYAYNIFALNGSTHRYLEQCYSRLTVATDRSGKIPVRNLVQIFSNCYKSSNKEDRRRVEKALDAAGIPSGRGDFIDPAKFSFREFFNFYKHLTGRTEVDQIFQQIFHQQSGGGVVKKARPYVTVDQFVTFLNNEQRDPRLNEILYPYYDRERALALIRQFEPNPACVAKEQLSVDGFLAFLMSDENAAIPVDALDRTEDMGKPLSHYFINSSHNTYLTGHQLNGRSSVEMYRQSLLVGCRCVELDCWNGQTADDEPIITHGYTFCTEVAFKDVIEAIAESAFKTSEYPLILSFENHITIPKQQHKVVQYCKEFFGDSLLTEALDSHPLEKNVPLPPPDLLKYKILIKNKKKSHSKHDAAGDDPAAAAAAASAGKSNSTSSATGGVEETPPTSPTSARDVAVVKDEFRDLLAADPPSSDGDTINAVSDNVQMDNVRIDIVDIDDAHNKSNGRSNPDEHIHAVLTEKPSIVDSDDDDDDEDDEDDDEDEAIDDEKVKERGTAVAEAEPSQEISAMVNYVQPVRFFSFDKAEKRGHTFECSSFAETEATRLLKEHPIDFVNYNKRQLSRVYPKGTRVDSSNYTPQMYWNAGCQLVALNFQSQDLGMMLNHGVFEYNGRCGYILKPDFMRREDRRLDPFIESTIDGIVANTVKVKIISGQFLSSAKKDPYVEVDMFGLPTDTLRKKYKTSPVSGNSINPIWNEEPFVFKKVVLPNLAHLRFCVYDENGKMLGHRVIPVRGLRPGYRHIHLRNEINQPVPLATLFIYLEVRDYVPDDFSEFAAALMNPIQYQKEQAIHHRTEQLRSTYFIDEEDDLENKAPVSFLPEDRLLAPNLDLLSQRRCSDNREVSSSICGEGHATVANTLSSPGDFRGGGGVGGGGAGGHSDGSSSHRDSGAFPITSPMVNGGVIGGDPRYSMDRQDSTSASEGLEDVDQVGPLQTPSEISRKGSKISNCLKKANSIGGGGTSDSENSFSESFSNMSRQPSITSSQGHNNNNNVMSSSQRHNQLTHQQSTTSSIVSIDSCPGGSGGGSGGRISGRHSTSTGGPSAASPDPKMDAFTLFLKESSLHKRSWSSCDLEKILADKSYEKLMAKQEKEMSVLKRKSWKGITKLKETLDANATQMEQREAKERQQLEKKMKKVKSKDEAAKRQIEFEVAEFNRCSEKRRATMQVEYAHALHEKSLKHLEEREARLLANFKAEFEHLGILLATYQRAQSEELENIYKEDEQKLRKDMELTHKDQVKELSKTHKDKQALSRRKREVEQQFVTEVVSKVERLRDLKGKRAQEVKTSQEKVVDQLGALRLERFTSLQKTIEAEKQELSEKYGVPASATNGGCGGGGGGGGGGPQNQHQNMRLSVYFAESLNGGEHPLQQSHSSSGSTDGTSSNGCLNTLGGGIPAEFDEATKL